MWWKPGELLDDGEHTKRKMMEAVTALLHRDQSTMADLVSRLAHSLGDRAEALGGQAHPTDRVPGSGILARGYKHQIGLQRLQGGTTIRSIAST